MSLEDILAYISPKTGWRWIWTKLGREIGWGKNNPIKFGEISPGAIKKEA